MKYSRIATSAVDVYDGMQRIGIVERHQRGFRAMDADRLGEFPTERAAMQAITSRAVTLRE